MITHKTYSLALLVLATLLSVSGCGSATPAGTATDAPAAATAQPTASSGAGNTGATRYKIALIVGKTTDPFYTSMQCGAQAKAAELGDVDLSVLGAADWDAKLQIPILQNAIGTKAQAIAIVVNDPKELYAPLKAANDAGIKILGVDTKLEDTSFEVTNISSDNYILGVEAAITLAKLIGDKGTVLTTPLDPNVATVNERTQGFIDEMKSNHPNITVVYTDPLMSGSTIEHDIEVYKAAINAHSDISGIYTTNTDHSEAATRVLKELPADRQSKINLVSFDASPDLADALRANKLQALVAQKPAEMGAIAVEMARQALRGEQVEKLIPTSGIGLTKDNIDKPEFAQYIYKSACQ